MQLDKEKCEICGAMAEVFMRTEAGEHFACMEHFTQFIFKPEGKKEVT